MLWKASEAKLKLKENPDFIITVSTWKLDKNVWVFGDCFFKKYRAKSILVHNPLGEVTCQLCWVVVWFWMCGKQTWTDPSLLKAMSSAGCKPRSRGCTGAPPHPALTHPVCFLLLMSYTVLSKTDSISHKWVSLALELYKMSLQFKKQWSKVTISYHQEPALVFYTNPKYIKNTMFKGLFCVRFYF